jgi:hypothetical protein
MTIIDDDDLYHDDDSHIAVGDVDDKDDNDDQNGDYFDNDR